MPSANTGASPVRRIPTASTRLESGELVELLYQPGDNATCFAVFDGERVREETALPERGRTLVPYSPENNLVRHAVVLLPSAVEPYGGMAELLAEVRAFIHRYVDLTPAFETVAANYVLFTWRYDDFNELPYLRVRGDYGSGKSRFLLTVGSLCYKPMFASGASTVSPIFRIIDAFQGTLVIDEGDFRASDEKAEIVKILNNGNARGFPVLRSEQVGQRKEYDPRAYHVFGPKLIATRGPFEDRALESRCLTEELGGRPLRPDIPVNLPAGFEAEARALRNKLLLFRFRNLGKPVDVAGAVDRGVEPRLAQVLSPLLATVEDEAARTELRALTRKFERDLVADRGLDVEAELLEIIRQRLAANEELSIKAIAEALNETHGTAYGRLVSARWVGSRLRRIGLRPERRHGVFVIPEHDECKLVRLFERYGIERTPTAFEGGGASNTGALFG